MRAKAISDKLLAQHPRLSHFILDGSQKGDLSIVVKNSDSPTMFAFLDNFVGKNNHTYEPNNADVESKLAAADESSSGSE